ncbi:MAG: right-handed parallel beta-helix repeat-containing protein, partial [Bacteroidales bacterium]
SDWYGIRFYNASIDTACILTACKIRYAGYNNTGGLSFENCSPTIIDCEITFSFSGIYIQMGGAPFVSNVTLSNCTYPYLYSAEGNITLTGNQTYIGNTHNYALLNFNYVYNLLGLPTIIIPYVINQNIIINSDASCNIGNGNIIKVYDGQYIDVYGKFKAIGTNTSNIYFTSFRDDNWGGDNNEDGIATAPSSGNWYGIKFFNSSNDTECIMRNCRVRYAGAGNLGGISMWDASPTIDSCNVSNSYFGIYVANASSPVLTNNLIGSSQMTPIAMSFEADPEFTNNTFSFSDNAYDAIGLISGSLTTNATLKIRSVTSIPNVTYLILGDITVPLGIQLNINKGIVIKSYSYYHRIMINGTLNANGSVDSLITFTSSKDDNYGNPADCNKDGAITSPQVGDWGGIIFAENSGGILNYCRIKYATVNNYSFSNCSTSEWLNNAAVVLIDASPTISNCEFKDLVYGISCYRVSNPSIINNSMINIQYTPFCISGSSNPSFAGITFTNVGRRAIGLLGGYICQNGTIKKRNVAGYNGISYVLLSDMTINAGTYVNIEPGVVVKVNNYYTNINVDGGFRTDGTTTQNVIFTSIQDDNEGNPLDVNGDGNATMPSAGNWGSINFRSTSDDAYCKLNFTNVKYAGSNGMGAVNFENAGGIIKNSTISNSYNYGVYCNGNSNPLIDSVIIQNCNLDPIAMSLTSNPILTNISFVSNYSKAIKIIEGTLSTNATLISRNVAGIANIAYIIDQLTISSNAKLIIQPDVVIKFRGSSYSCITVNGNLIAKGLNTHRIHFTSFKDDSKGGDSNNDGNLSSPAKSDWGNYYVNAGIKFINNNINADTVNHLKNCEISYAYNGIRVENSHVTFDSCVIQQCGAYGIVVVGSANPDIKNTDFYNISNTPVELSMFSNPIFTNCTALNIGNMALSVIPETYSQSATIPSRNFGGYTNITYLMEGVCTVNSGTTITIPSGLSFKSSEYVTGFKVNGRLNILGTSSNPVIFTNIKDDTYGNPSDMNQDGSASHPNNGYQGWGNNWLTFNDVSDDSSIIKNVIFRYANTGIYTLSASPLIDSVVFDNLYYGVDMNGVSAPEIDNCIFQNLQYYPLQISLVSYPSSSSNNLISGSTYKMIKVRDETLTQDVTLPKRSFGGLINIPYLFSNYTVGTGATLTINPGVVCKFYGGGINIYKGFIAEGGFAADSNIVFTDYRDDFYGGDANA